MLVSIKAEDYIFPQQVRSRANNLRTSGSLPPSVVFYIFKIRKQREREREGEKEGVDYMNKKKKRIPHEKVTISPTATRGKSSSRGTSNVAPFGLNKKKKKKKYIKRKTRKVRSNS